MSASISAPDSNKPTLYEWFHDPATAPNYPQILLMDGGVSTHLEELIAPHTFAHRELWSSSLLLTQEGRSKILQGHQDWLLAGSNIITTVTYQCHYGLVTAAEDGNEMVVSKETMTEMIQNGVMLAQQAVSETPQHNSAMPGPYVVASTGPYGAAMADGSEYTGKYPNEVTREALYEFHIQKARALLNCRPDGLAVETIPNLGEVRVVCEVLRELQENLDVPVACWISLACRNQHELNDGRSLEEALDVIRSCDPERRYIAAVGVNCCDSAHIMSLVDIIVDASIKDGPGPRGIPVYPNSGEAWDAANEQWKDGTGADDTQFTDRIMDVVEMIQDAGDEMDGSGVAQKIVVGGCCRTSEKTIAALRKRINELQE
jgi:homocysteine S-methyltransferase